MIHPALCPTLTPPSNGAVTWDGLTHGSTATYTCDTGYYMAGDNPRTCQNGVWSGQEPVCTRMTLLCVCTLTTTKYNTTYYSLTVHLHY